jgi:hypothetical protein
MSVVRPEVTVNPGCRAIRRIMTAKQRIIGFTIHACERACGIRDTRA